MSSRGDGGDCRGSSSTACSVELAAASQASFASAGSTATARRMMFPINAHRSSRSHRRIGVDGDDGFDDDDDEEDGFTGPCTVLVAPRQVGDDGKMVGAGVAAD